MMAVALALIHLKDTTRSIYLFDTYEGMTAPTQIDKRVGLDLQASAMPASVTRSHILWGESPIEEVKVNLASTGYPAEKLFG
jgi:O-methyltransferase